MQDRPTATELLGDVAELLDEVTRAVDAPLRHQVRVAANVCRIVERELRLGPAMAQREDELVRSLLGDATPGASLVDLHADLAVRLRHGDDAARREAVPVLLTIARDKLAVTKPGYDTEAAGPR